MVGFAHTRLCLWRTLCASEKFKSSIGVQSTPPSKHSHEIAALPQLRKI